MALRLKTKKEIDIMRECGKRLGAILSLLKNAVRPGLTTGELNSYAERLIEEAGGIAVFKNYVVDDAPPYPAVICTSVNDEVVHGIPRNDRMLHEGDIIGIDIGMGWPKNPKKDIPDYAGPALITDTALTVGVGGISKEAEDLIKKTSEALFFGIEEVKKGNRIGDISARIEKALSLSRFGIVKGLAGHGVGYTLHEDPLIPNYGKVGTGPQIEPGMVIAIEPMATLGKGEVLLGSDGWTFTTRDHSLAAHFEHTIAVGADGIEILTMV